LGVGPLHVFGWIVPDKARTPWTPRPTSSLRATVEDLTSRRLCAAPPEAFKYGDMTPTVANKFDPMLGVYSSSDWLECWQSCCDNIDYEIDEIDGEVRSLH
jgi:hypothetical protein